MIYPISFYTNLIKIQEKYRIVLRKITKKNRPETGEGKKLTKNTEAKKKHLKSENVLYIIAKC